MIKNECNIPVGCLTQFSEPRDGKFVFVEHLCIGAWLTPYFKITERGIYYATTKERFDAGVLTKLDLDHTQQLMNRISELETKVSDMAYKVRLERERREEVEELLNRINSRVIPGVSDSSDAAVDIIREQSEQLLLVRKKVCEAASKLQEVLK